MTRERNLTIEELDNLYAMRMTVREHWISPDEGYEYKSAFMGGKTLAIKKSPRAAYNFCVRHYKELHKDDK